MGTVRFLLALCVVAAHSPGSAILGVSLFSGITAVQCFYVISGFLITMILNERTGYQSLGNFYLSRYLRLWPAYILIATLSLTLFKRDTMFLQMPGLVGWPEMAFIAFSNLTLFFQDWFLFLKFDGGRLVPTAAFGLDAGPQVNTFLLVPQCWTLGIELTFYAIAPFVCRRWWSVVGLFAFGTIVRLVVASLHPPALDPWLYRFAPSEMMMFGSGAIAYFVGRNICPRFPRATTLIGFASMVVFSAIVFSPPLVDPVKYFGDINRYLLLWYWPVLALMAITAPAMFFATRNNRLDQLLGELSYPMYISHILVFGLVNRYAPADLQDGNVLYVVCVIAVSLLLVFLVTAPIDKVRKRLWSSVGHESRNLARFVSRWNWLGFKENAPHP